jgi:hypothetical protein
MSEGDAHLFVDEMLNVTGVEETVLHYEEAILYLKVDNQLLDKEKLQTLINKHIHAYASIV